MDSQMERSGRKLQTINSRKAERVGNMTKKDYELFAYKINQKINNHQAKGTTALQALQPFIDICKEVFKEDNNAFQPDKFERACYEGKHIRKAISGKV